MVSTIATPAKAAAMKKLDEKPPVLSARTLQPRDGDLAEPEDESDETEGSERFINAHIRLQPRP
jgi:hypothetical protein